MGSVTSVHRPRMKKSEYESLKNNINKEHFYNFYLNNCNDYVCSEFNINLNTVYKLLKDFDIKLTKEQVRYKNKIASEQKSLEKLGVKNPFSLTEVQAKVIETNLTKYGVENVFAAEEIKNKIKKANLENYGVEYVSQRQDVKQKVKNTCLEKYGVENFAKTLECREKAVSTMLNKYGRANLGQFGSQENAEAMIRKYGVEHYSKTLDFHIKARKHYIYENFTFDSLPELAVWVYCIDNNISIERNPCSFEYIFENKSHKYFPDFKIDGKLVEIKGDHFFNEDGTMQNPFDRSQNALYEAKHQCGIQNNVEFWKSDKYIPYIKYFNENYNISDYIFKKKEGT